MRKNEISYEDIHEQNWSVAVSGLRPRTNRTPYVLTPGEKPYPDGLRRMQYGGANAVREV